MAKLQAVTENDGYFTWVTFINDQIEFELYDVPITDYYEAAHACRNNINWESSMISVNNGIVSILIVKTGDGTGGSMKYKIDAKYCQEAFMAAYYALSAEVA